MNLLQYIEYVFGTVDTVGISSNNTMLNNAPIHFQPFMG